VRHHDDVRAAVFEWVNWSNHERLHTSLRMQSPDEYEQTLHGQLLMA
jgi:transposase InsO family protein